MTKDTREAHRLNEQEDKKNTLPPHMYLYQQGLTTAQREVVEHPAQGPGQLVIAGAGSGKTRVIMARCERLIAQGVEPSSILVTTFSRRAAEELAHRAHGGLRDVRWTTLHSWGLSVLEAAAGRRHTVLAGAKAWMAFKRLALQSGGEASSSNLWSIWRLFGKLKAHPIGAGAVGGWFHEQDRQLGERAVSLFQLYERAKREQGVIDYDDMIYQAWHRLLDPAARTQLLGHLRFVFVDEVQDLNPVQLALCDILGQDAQLTLVGDLAQSIYSFRHSEPASVLIHARRHKLQRRLLPENFRCGRSIVQAANNLIDQMPKALPAHASAPVSKTAGQIEVRAAQDIQHEALLIVEELRTRLLIGQRADQMAILCRTRAQMAAVELAVHQAKIEYTTLGPGFFDAIEIRQAIDMLRLFTKPQQHITAADLALLAKIPPLALPQGWEARFGDGDDALLQIRHVLKTRPNAPENKGLFNLVARYDRVVQGQDGNRSAQKALQSIYSLADTSRHWQTFYQWGSFIDQSEPDDRRSDNLDALHVLAAQHTIVQFLATLPSRTTTKQGVRIGTIHRAKGLEFDDVFLPGWSQGLLPHERCPLDEERRLAYVALTRARAFVWISHPASRGHGPSLSPSQFIKELQL